MQRSKAPTEPAPTKGARSTKRDAGRAGKSWRQPVHSSTAELQSENGRTGFRARKLLGKQSERRSKGNSVCTTENPPGRLKKRKGVRNDAWFLIQTDHAHLQDRTGGTHGDQKIGNGTRTGAGVGCTGLRPKGSSMIWDGFAGT